MAFINGKKGKNGIHITNSMGICEFHSSFDFPIQRILSSSFMDLLAILLRHQWECLQRQLWIGEHCQSRLPVSSIGIARTMMASFPHNMNLAKTSFRNPLESDRCLWWIPLCHGKIFCKGNKSKIPILPYSSLDRLSMGGWKIGSS